MPSHNKEINPEELAQEKFDIVVSVLEVVEKNTRLVISGSLAQVLSRKSEEKNESLAAGDIVSLGDIDVIQTDFRAIPDIQELVEKAKNAVLPIECAPVFDPCMYDAAIKHLAISTTSIQVGERQFIVRCNTPEFLLLSLVNSPVSEKTSKEKMLRKVLGLQQHPGFQKQRFLDLAHYERSFLYRLNEETFRSWKQQVLELRQLFDEATAWNQLEQKLSEMESLIDEAAFKNRVRNFEDLETLEFNEVREISYLERFLTEYENGE